MKIVQISLADMAGAAYHLCHALNKTGKVEAVNIRSNNNLFNYPTIASGHTLGAENIRSLLKQADVIVFHSAVRPYFQSLIGITSDMIVGKKVFLYFHGTEARTMGEDILSQADEYLGYGKYTVLVSTPDLREYIPAAKWMPVCRSFSEIEDRYMQHGADKAALDSFNLKQNKIIFCHAPSNPQIKGTPVFYKAITDVVQSVPDVEYTPITNKSWEETLRIMSEADVYYDQCVLGAYGAAAVEASVFKLPVFCLLNKNVADEMKKESDGLQPFIQWASDDDLRTQSYILATNAEFRKKFGLGGYEYCKKIHDEPAVAQRFLRYVAEAPVCTGPLPGEKATPEEIAAVEGEKVEDKPTAT